MTVFFDWIENNRELLVSVALVISISSLIVVPQAIRRMPADYFLGPKPPRLPWADAHTVPKVLLTLVKNVLGVILVLAGIVMLVSPGQGLLAILVGAMLVDFPGKRPIELALIRKKRVHAVLNWIRRRAGRGPLLVEEESVRDEQEP